DRRARDADLRTLRDGEPGPGRAGGGRRLRARPHPVHRPRRALPRRRAGLRPGRQEPLHDERGVLHRDRPAPGPPGRTPADPGPGRHHRQQGAGRRRRRGHRQDPRVGARLLRRLRRRGADGGHLREAAVGGDVRLRVAAHRPVDQLPLVDAAPRRPAQRPPRPL
ncbi:MAG: Xanthine-guanine phosphoribosyltransferase, partial [uncultured Blastococcus sp.]